MKSLLKINILNIIVSLFVLSLLLVFYTANVILSEAKNTAQPQNITEIEGRIVTIHGDDFDYRTKRIKSSYTKTYLQTKNKELIELKPNTFTTTPNINSIKPNTVVKVKGTKTKDRIIYYKITPVKQNKPIKLNYKKINKLNYLQQPSIPDAIGEQKTLVALFNYADDQSQPISLDEIKNHIMYDTQSVNNFVKENSYNKAWLNPTFFDWRALPSSAADYRENKFLALDDAIKALENEVYLPDYNRSIFFFLPWSNPDGPDGSYLGYAFATDYPLNNGDYYLPVAYISAMNNLGDTLFKDTTAHEFGHGFYFGHAASFNALGDTKIPPDLLDIGLNTSQGGTYAYSEYGDGDDNMGGGYEHWSTIWKERAGWLESSQIKIVTQSAEYELDQVELPSDGIKMLKVPIGYDVEGREAAYFLEYRKPLGLFDDDDAVQVRLKNWHYGRRWGNWDFSNNTVRFGTDANTDQPFFDPYRGIKVELLEKTGEDANSKVRVKVTFSGVELNSNNYLMRYKESEYDINPQILTVFNNTTTSLDIGQLSIEGRNSSSFEVLDDNISNKTFGVGESITISIHFSPTTSGNKFAYLNIPTNNEIRPNATMSLYGWDGSGPGYDWPKEAVNVYAPAFSTNTSNTNSFNISWLTTDSFSTIDGYELQYHPHTTTAWQTYKIDGSDWTPKESATFIGKPGYNYYFKVRAKDRAQNQGNFSSIKRTIIPFDNTSLRYSSNWKNATSSSAFKKTLKYSYTKGSYATVIFSGVLRSLIAPKGPSRGIIDVYIRSKSNGTWSKYSKFKSIDLYSSTYKSRVPISIEAGKYNNSVHQIKFVVTGRKRTASTSTRVYIDGIAILKYVKGYYY